MNLPNKLTLLRIIMVPFFVFCFYIKIDGWHIIASAVFLIAFLTDILDGAIARNQHLVTDFGKLMDPIADKLLTVSALVMLTSKDMISPIVTIIIISREFIVSGVRLVALSEGRVVAASPLGKAKTVMQTIAILDVMLKNPLFGKSFPMDQVLIWLAVAITVISGADYVLKNVKNMKLK